MESTVVRRFHAKDGDRVVSENAGVMPDRHENRSGFDAERDQWSNRLIAREGAYEGRYDGRDDLGDRDGGWYYQRAASSLREAARDSRAYRNISRQTNGRLS